MYEVPLLPIPNQTFQITIPVNNENKIFQLNLKYNEVAKYWVVSAIDLQTKEELFSEQPFLSSNFKFRDILCQLGYKNIGKCYCVNVGQNRDSMANEANIGSEFVMLWGDNENI